MSTEFASASLTAGQLNAIVKKLGGHDMALRFLRDELSVSEPTRSWREEDGVIYFSVTSDGTTGEDWIKCLEGNGFRIGHYAKQVLRSPDLLHASRSGDGRWLSAYYGRPDSGWNRDLGFAFAVS